MWSGSVAGAEIITFFTGPRMCFRASSPVVKSPVDSTTIEALTDALAREAWQLFQHVEAEGGYAQALSTGSIAISLAASRATREKAISSRRRSLVGVNNYPNVAEKMPGAAALPAFEDDPLPQVRLAEPFEKLRERTARHAAATGRYPKILLLERGDVKMRTARDRKSVV